MKSNHQERRAVQSQSSVLKQWASRLMSFVFRNERRTGDLMKRQILALVTGGKGQRCEDHGRHSWRSSSTTADSESVLEKPTFSWTEKLRSDGEDFNVGRTGLSTSYGKLSAISTGMTDANTSGRSQRAELGRVTRSLPGFAYTDTEV